MTNDVLKIEGKPNEDALKYYDNIQIINTKEVDYSTFNNELSLVYNEQTSHFDLYKGFFFIFISCLFKSLFSLLCKILLDKNKTITSFHLLAYKVYIMLGITLFVSTIILIKSYRNKKNENDTENNDCSQTENNINCKNQNNSEMERDLKNNLQQFSQYKEKLVFDFKKKDLYMVFLRSVLSVLSVSLAIFGLQRISISNYFSIYYVYPALVIILSYFILREKIRKTDYICLISCFTGMMFIIRPEFIFSNSHLENNEKNFYIIVIFAAIFKSFEDILVRNIGKDIHCLIVPFAYSIVGIVLYPCILMLAVEKSGKVSLSFMDLVLLFLISASSFVYQLFLTLGFQNEKAGRASMINYLQIPLMFIVDMIFFNKPFILYDIIGTFIIFIFNFGNSFFIVAKRSHSLKKFKRTKE